MIWWCSLDSHWTTFLTLTLFTLVIFSTILILITLFCACILWLADLLIILLLLALTIHRLTVICRLTEYWNNNQSIHLFKPYIIKVQNWKLKIFTRFSFFLSSTPPSTSTTISIRVKMVIISSDPAGHPTKPPTGEMQNSNINYNLNSLLWL